MVFVPFIATLVALSLGAGLIPVVLSTSAGPSASIPFLPSATSSAGIPLRPTVAHATALMLAMFAQMGQETQDTNHDDDPSDDLPQRPGEILLLFRQGDEPISRRQRECP